jgi:hypothetical protein
VQLVDGTGDFRLLSPPVVGALTDMREGTRFSKARLSTTSYLLPQLSQRQQVSFPRTRRDTTSLEQLDALLRNPKDPGWGSSRAREQELWREDGEHRCLFAEVAGEFDSISQTGRARV